MKNNGASGGFYFLAFVGAFVYFITHAHTFLQGILGFFQAVFWPSVIMYKVLELLKM